MTIKIELPEDFTFEELGKIIEFYQKLYGIEIKIISYE